MSSASTISKAQTISCRPDHSAPELHRLGAHEHGSAYWRGGWRGGRWTYSARTDTCCTQQPYPRNTPKAQLPKDSLRPVAFAAGGVVRQRGALTTSLSAAAATSPAADAQEARTMTMTCGCHQHMRC